MATAMRWQLRCVLRLSIAADQIAPECLTSHPLICLTSPGNWRTPMADPQDRSLVQMVADAIYDNGTGDGTHKEA